MPKTLVTMMDTPIILQDPYGVVLVIGSWNYPIQLGLIPVSGAIAAGKCVVIKPSEVSPASAKLLEELVPRYLDQVFCLNVTLARFHVSTMSSFSCGYLGLLSGGHWRASRHARFAEATI